MYAVAFYYLRRTSMEHSFTVIATNLKQWNLKRHLKTYFSKLLKQLFFCSFIEYL